MRINTSGGVADASLGFKQPTQLATPDSMLSLVNAVFFLPPSSTRFSTPKGGVKGFPVVHDDGECLLTSDEAIMALWNEGPGLTSI